MEESKRHTHKKGGAHHHTEDADRRTFGRRSEDVFMRHTLAFMAVVVFVMIGVIATMVAVEHNRDKAETERQRRGQQLVQDVILCLLAQQNDHRLNNSASHEVIIDALGLSPPPPHAPPALTSLPPAEVACARFDPIVTGAD